MTEAIRAVEADPVNFGGAYVDLAGSPLHILYAIDDPAARARVAALLPSDLPVEWRSVRYSTAELARIDVGIEELGQQLGSDVITAVFVDVPNNRVVVATAERRPELELGLAARYGPAVTFGEAPGKAIICDFPDSDELPVCQ